MSDDADSKAADYRMASRVAIAGALGGLLSWAAAWIARGDTSFASILAIVPLGAGAAILGVYVVTNTDTDEKIRCLGFALACGFTWQPVYEGASALVQQTIEQRAEKASDEELPGLEAKTDGVERADAASLAKAIEDAATAAIGVIETSRSLDSVSARARALEAVDALTVAISNRVSESPDAAVDALADIARAAAESQAPDLVRRAWEVTEPSSLATMDAGTAAKVAGKARERQPEVQRAASRAGDPRLATTIGRTTAVSTLTTWVRAKEANRTEDAKRLETLRLDEAAQDLTPSKLVAPRGGTVRPQVRRPLTKDDTTRLLSDKETMRKFLIDRDSLTPR